MEGIAKMQRATYQELLDIMRKVFPDIQTASADHPIYSEGASTTFIGSSPKGIFIEPDDDDEPSVEYVYKEHVNLCAFNSTTRKIFNELKSDYLHCNHSLDVNDVSYLIELDEDTEKVDWVSSTWIEPRAINLHICTVAGEIDNVFATEHGDGGVLDEISGPWLTTDDAKASYGLVGEGWSDM
jgi:hypothetical protein